MVDNKLALFGGKPVREEPYPAWPVHDEREIEAVTEVIKSGQWGGYPYPGPWTKKFTEKFAEMQGGGYAVAMVNGTVTMEVALRAAGIGWGDEVIVPAFSFMATAAAPMSAGAIPVLIDVDPNNFCADPKAIETAITKKTKAIIVVHLGSQMTDMDAVMEIAEKYDLIVIEDSAHAHGAKWNGKGAGTIGHFGSFSLQSSKILTTGEGGILLCRTKELAARAAGIVDCGRSHFGESCSEKGNTFQMGSNYRMTELQAALGVVALERFPEQVAQREKMVAYMDSSLEEVPGVRVLKHDERHTTRSFYQYTFAIDPEVYGMEHEVLCYALEKEGIPAHTGYEAMHHYTLFNPKSSKLAVPNAFPEYFDFENMSLPEAERACEHEAVWLGESVFRAGEKGVDDVIVALLKIREAAPQLRAAEAQLRKQAETEDN
jgi:dTDP-4-amino-4,6-dideoxygalactose transaminase